MMDASALPSGAIGRYLRFVACAVLLSLAVNTAAATGGLTLAFLRNFGLVLVFGVVLWGPVALFAVFPGRWIFGRIRGALRGGRSLNMAGTALASVAVAGVGAFGGALVYWRVLVPDEGAREFGGLAVLLFTVGAPCVIASALLFYRGEDRRNA